MNTILVRIVSVEPLLLEWGLVDHASILHQGSGSLHECETKLRKHARVNLPCLWLVPGELVHNLTLELPAVNPRYVPNALSALLEENLCCDMDSSHLSYQKNGDTYRVSVIESTAIQIIHELTAAFPAWQHRAYADFNCLPIIERGCTLACSDNKIWVRLDAFHGFAAHPNTAPSILQQYLAQTEDTPESVDYRLDSNMTERHVPERIIELLNHVDSTQQVDASIFAIFAQNAAHLHKSKLPDLFHGRYRGYAQRSQSLLLLAVLLATLLFVGLDVVRYSLEKKHLNTLIQEQKHLLAELYQQLPAPWQQEHPLSAANILEVSEQLENDFMAYYRPVAQQLFLHRDGLELQMLHYTNQQLHGRLVWHHFEPMEQFIASMQSMPGSFDHELSSQEPNTMLFTYTVRK